MWAFINSNYQGYWKGQFGACVSLTVGGCSGDAAAPPSPGRTLWSSPTGPRCMGCPRECPGQPPPGLAQVFAVRLMADLGSGRCLPLVQGGENLDPHPECSQNPKGCCQVSPASSGLGFIIPNFVLEDPLSCKSKRHFYYYFQLLHDSYYSSALTSAINNNRIVNYCSF